MIKKILNFTFLLIAFFICNTNVNAANLDSMSFANRVQGNFPFTTFYDAADYSGQYYLFNGASELPSYAIYTTCATGPLTFSIQNQQGNLSYMGYVDLGGSCSVGQYTGSTYVYYFNLISYTDAGNGNMGINYSMSIGPDVPYVVWVTFTSVSFSSSSDFTSAIQNQTLIQNQNKITEEQEKTNEELKDMNENITSEEGPNTSQLGDVAGWLPAGPVDSLINLPLSLFNSISRDLSGSCNPITLPLPYVNKNLTLPCMSSFYDGIGIGDFMDWIGIIASGFILFSYLMKLYKWVDDTLTFRENNHLDNWGGV